MYIYCSCFSPVWLLSHPLLSVSPQSFHDSFPLHSEVHPYTFSIFLNILCTLQKGVLVLGIKAMKIYISLLGLP